MGHLQNEGLQAVGKAATVFDQVQKRDRLQASGQGHGKPDDKPDDKSVSATESRPYVVNLTDEALKRSDDSKAPSTEKSGDVTGNAEQGSLIESGKSVAGADSGAQESRPASLVKQQEIESGFKKFGRIDHTVKSAPEEAAERAAAGEPEQTENETAEAGTTGAEKVAGGLKDPGTIQGKPESTQADTAAIGSVDKAKEPEALERTGTVAAPLEKRTTERVEKLDTAEELRKSISVYA